MQLEQRHTLLTDNQHLSIKDNHKRAEEHQHPNRCNDEDDDIVPVVIRPGHIRFEPFSKGVCVLVGWMDMVVLAS